MLYLADTHSLVWFLTDSSKLGKKALELLNRAERGNGIIFIPTIVLAEIMYICERKKAAIKFKDVLRKLENSSNYIVYNLDLGVLNKSQGLTKIHELHDRIIVATAQIVRAKILTKDEDIKNSGYAETIW